MKWPLRRRRVSAEKNGDLHDLQRAKHQLRFVKSQWPEVNALVSRLGRLNEQNHFTQLITEAMQGGRE